MAERRIGHLPGAGGVGGEEVRFVCAHCRVDFSTRTGLDQHGKAQHPGERPVVTHHLGLEPVRVELPDAVGDDLLQEQMNNIRFRQRTIRELGSRGDPNEMNRLSKELADLLKEERQRDLKNKAKAEKMTPADKTKVILREVAAWPETDRRNLLQALTAAQEHRGGMALVK